MKKMLTLLFTMAMLFSLTACGGNSEVSYGGTWKVEYIEYEGSKFTVEEWDNMESEDWSDFYVIFKDGGKAYVYDDGYGDLVDWLESDNAIMIGDEKCEIVDGKICIDYYGDMICLTKVSDNQEIPKGEDEDTDVESEEENNLSTTTTKGTTTTEKPTTTQTENDELDADFKEAMDSYEKFMNDYVDFMKKYQNNPSDLSLLSNYATYMNDYAAVVADFEKWDSEDMSASEAAYYLDVQTRVNKKLLEIAS